jgi:hypothetical protein
MSSIVISCAGDTELAMKINNSLMERIVQSKDNLYISPKVDGTANTTSMQHQEWMK